MNLLHKLGLCRKSKYKLILSIVMLMSLYILVNAFWIQTGFVIQNNKAPKTKATEFDIFDVPTRPSGRLRPGDIRTSEIPILKLKEIYKVLHKQERVNRQKNVETTNLINDFKKRLPQCIVIGFGKAGTMALIRFLELNKHIKTAHKEVYFFDRNYNKGYDWYRDQMPYSYSDQITIEKTPTYVLKDEVPDRIFKMNSSIKLILIVKEPVLRSISKYTQDYENKKINRTVSYQDLAINRKTGEVNINYTTIRGSIYYKNMPKWLSKFPRKQLLIVDGDNIVKTPSRELNKVEEFLGLKPEIRDDMFYLDEKKGFYCGKRDTFSTPICLGKQKGRKHPLVSPDVIRKLQEFYRPYNELFFKQVGQRFNWP